MIIALYNLLIFFQAVYVLGNGYAAVKFYKVNHRWGRWVALAFAANAFGGLCNLLRFGFGPRPSRLDWWVIAVSLLGPIVAAAGIAVLNIFLFGWINGVGNYKKEGGQ